MRTFCDLYIRNIDRYWHGIANCMYTNIFRHCLHFIEWGVLCRFARYLIEIYIGTCIQYIIHANNGNVELEISLFNAMSIKLFIISKFYLFHILISIKNDLSIFVYNH